jgi:hypothetical protein
MNILPFTEHHMVGAETLLDVLSRITELHAELICTRNGTYGNVRCCNFPCICLMQLPCSLQQEQCFAVYGSALLCVILNTSVCQ